MLGRSRHTLPSPGRSRDECGTTPCGDCQRRRRLDMRVNPAPMEGAGPGRDLPPIQGSAADASVGLVSGAKSCSVREAQYEGWGRTHMERVLGITNPISEESPRLDDLFTTET